MDKRSNNFKQETIATNLNSACDEETICQLKEAFAIFDNKRTGKINPRQLKSIMKAFGIQATKQDVKDIFAELGKQLKEGLNLNQFLRMMTTKMSPINSKQEIYRIFKVFDEDSVEKISFGNMKKLSMEVGERISDEDLKKMLESADKDGDGMLNFEEFYLVMKEYGNETG